MIGGLSRLPTVIAIFDTASKSPAETAILRLHGVRRMMHACCGSYGTRRGDRKTSLNNIHAKPR